MLLIGRPSDWFQPGRGQSPIGRPGSGVVRPGGNEKPEGAAAGERRAVQSRCLRRGNSAVMRQPPGAVLRQVFPPSTAPFCSF